MIDKGANVFVKDKNGYTALINATKNGYKDTVKVLLNNDADVYAKAKGGMTAMDAALLNGYAEIAEILKNHRSKDWE